MIGSKLILDFETCAIDGADAYADSEPLSAPANYKDPIKIAEYLEKAALRRLASHGLDPDLGRICCGGWMLEGRDLEPHVFECRDEDQERLMLIELWRELLLPNGSTRAIVSFNGLRFDLPYIMRRSLYLDIREVPYLNIDKYRSPHIDLEAKLSFNGAIKEHSLMFYAKRFGLPIPEGAADVDGSMIQGLVNEGSWDAIRAHCQSDVLLTYLLAGRLGYIEQADEATERQEVLSASPF